MVTRAAALHVRHVRMIAPSRISQPDYVVKIAADLGKRPVEQREVVVASFSPRVNELLDPAGDVHLVIHLIFLALERYYLLLDGIRHAVEAIRAGRFRRPSYVGARVQVARLISRLFSWSA